MKSLPKTKNTTGRVAMKNLTLGELIASTYRACGEQEASKVLQFAIDSQIVRAKK